MAYTLARVIMAGADLGGFEALKEEPAAAAEVAERCGTDPGATGKLLFALASTDYVRHRGERFELTPVARKWLLAERPGGLRDDLGDEDWDVVMIVQLVHHFSDEQNRELAARVARALRPGGVYAIMDAFRPKTPGEAGQVGAMLEFYFALTSQSGTWTPEEMADWQRAAGLSPKRPIRFRTTPGAGIQAAVKR